MVPLPFYIPAVFIVASFLTIYLFYRASNRNGKLLIIIAGWASIQSAIALTGFFTKTYLLPPRFVLLVAVPLIIIVIVFSSAKGKRFIDRFNVKTLTLLHGIRMLVELILYWLFLHKLMPELMTFEGRNFDFVSGISMPIVYYFTFIKKKTGTKTLLAWNFICLSILLFTVSNAILSAPTPFQKFAFDQPTVAVLYFPFVLLPGLVVPLVVFSHLITIRILLKDKWGKETSPVLRMQQTV